MAGGGIVSGRGFGLVSAGDVPEVAERLFGLLRRWNPGPQSAIDFNVFRREMWPKRPNVSLGVVGLPVGLSFNRYVQLERWRCGRSPASEAPNEEALEA